MVRVWFLLGLVVAIVYVYSIVDCALLERERVRGLSRGVWILVIILFPLVGSALWFLIGRGAARTTPPPVRRVLAPDDDPDFLARIAREHGKAKRPPRGTRKPGEGNGRDA